MCSMISAVFGILKILAMLLAVFILSYIALMIFASIFAGIAAHRLYGNRKRFYEDGEDSKGVEDNMTFYTPSSTPIDCLHEDSEKPTDDAAYKFVPPSTPSTSSGDA